MALRSRALMLLSAAGKDGGAGAATKTPSLFENVRQRVVTGKLLRPDVEDDTLRLPVDQSKFRHPSPGAQPQPVVPQGPYKNVFDISYYSRDSRRKMLKEQVDPSVVAKADLPPTPGNPLRSTYLGLAGDFDVKQ